ncbi:MAG TPA: DUF1501 domain-containing protein [Verrucomicrobiae bacterium]|nr:DUF1501 domain-containing protein [Verrucomicrobiae bacterium]
MNTFPELKTRREFLRTTILGGALTWTVPAFLGQTFVALQSEAAGQTQADTGKDSPILVVLQLAGGNDGVNTVIPFTNDFYYRARPRLGTVAKNALRLNDSLGLHPALSGFKSLFDAGHLGVVQGIGYPNPNRSHFRSTEIWQTASDENKFERFGWLGRYFDNACSGADPAVGISIGRQMPQAFASAKPAGVSLDNPENYRYASMDDLDNGDMASGSEEYFKQLNQPEMEHRAKGQDDLMTGATVGAVAGKAPAGMSSLDFLERTALDAQVSSERIRGVTKMGVNHGPYPASALAGGLKMVARLIAGGMPTRVYYVSQGGYDTHTNQAGAHQRLLEDLGGSLKSFTDDLKAQGNLDRVLIMTFSEFGRRLAENANGGTDHGAAAPMFLIGGKVKPGLHGVYPSLAANDLHNGDPKFTTDFRSVYAGVLEQWLRTPSAPVLGKQFTPLPIV